MNEGPPKKKSREAPKVPGVLSDAEYLKQLRENGEKNNSKRPPDSAILPVLDDVVSSPAASAEQVFNELIARVKTKKKPPAGWNDTVPTLPLSDEVKMSDDITVRALPVLTDVAPGSTSVDIEVASPRKEIPPIVLKALSMLFKKVEVSPDGQQVILKRKFQEPFAISIKDAPRMVSLEAERIRIEKEEETPPSNQDFVDTVPSAVADIPKGPSLSDPMIQRKLLDASERNRGELGQLNDEISRRVQAEEMNGINQGEEVSDVRRIEHTQEIYDPIVGETTDRLERRSKVLRVLSEDVEDATIIEPKTAIEKAEKTTAGGAVQSETEDSESAFSGSEISDSVIGDMYRAKKGIGFDPSQSEAPDTVIAQRVQPKKKAKQTEVSVPNTSGDKELISQYDAALRRFGLEEKKPKGPAIAAENKDAKIPSSYEAALKRYPNTDPKLKTMPEAQNNRPIIPESSLGESRMLSKDEIVAGAKQFGEMRKAQETRTGDREELDRIGNDIDTKLPLKNRDIDILLDDSKVPTTKKPEQASAVDIELPPVTVEKESLPVLTDVVSSPTVDIDSTIKEDGIDIILPTYTRVAAKLERNEKRARSIADIEQEINYIESENKLPFSNKYYTDRYPELKKIYQEGRLDDPTHARAWAWLEQHLKDLKSEVMEAALTAPKFFEQRFEKDFGISQTELLKIEGFKKLSNGQQMLVYENLKEYAEQESRGEAAAMWASVRGIMGQAVEKAPRKDAVGIEEYRGFLSKLILTTALHGPKIYLEKGEVISGFIDTEKKEDFDFQPDLVGIKHLDRVVRFEQKEVADNLNKAAHAFAWIPASWQEDGNGVHAKNESKITTFFKETLFKTESRNQYRKYEAQQHAYEKAKRAFAEQLEATGVPREQIVRKLIDVDAKVHQLRFIETSPEATALLQSVPDKTFWQKVGGAVKAGGVYAALGTVGRTMTGSALGALSGPAVAATLAGTRAWNKTAAEQRERDRKARTGTIDTSEGALNIVPASHIVKTAEGPLDTGITAKLGRLVEEYRKLPEDADPKERTRLLNQLKARTTYSQDKFKLNRIQFGDKKNFAVNQARFFEVLANAQVLIAEAEMPQGGLEVRLKQYLDYREGAINNRRHAEQRRKVALASSVAAGMAVAGAYAAHEFLKTDLGQSAVEKVKEWFTWDTTPTAAVGDDIEKIKVSRGTEVLEKTMTASELAERSVVSDEPLEKIEPLPIEEKFSSVKEIPELKEISTVRSAPVEAEVVAQVTEAQTVPQSPTAAEKAEIARLFAERVEKLPAPTALDIQGGRILETFFLKANVPPQAWVNVRDIPVRSFILDSMERGTVAQRTPSLVQLGKIFREAAKPPYNVATYPNESTEIYTHRVFTAISQAAKIQQNTTSMKELLYPNN